MELDLELWLRANIKRFFLIFVSCRKPGSDNTEAIMESVNELLNTTVTSLIKRSMKKRSYRSLLAPICEKTEVRNTADVSEISFLRSDDLSTKPTLRKITNQIYNRSLYMTKPINKRIHLCSYSSKRIYTSILNRCKYIRSIIERFYTSSLNKRCFTDRFSTVIPAFQ